jgi:type VI protein secretion system component Hcp
MDETKKLEQQEQNTEAAPNEERNQELSSKELDKVAGGLSLNFTKIEWTYTQQKADGAADGNEGAK